MRQGHCRISPAGEGGQGGARALRRRAALRTGEGVGKWARASARRGDMYGTQAAMPKSPYPHGRGRKGLLYRTTLHPKKQILIYHLRLVQLVSSGVISALWAATARGAPTRDRLGGAAQSSCCGRRAAEKSARSARFRTARTSSMSALVRALVDEQHDQQWQQIVA